MHLFLRKAGRDYTFDPENQQRLAFHRLYRQVTDRKRSTVGSDFTLISQKELASVEHLGQTHAPYLATAAWHQSRHMDYLQTPSIAEDYDSYFADHPLLKLDIEIVRRYLPEPPIGRTDDQPLTLADLGCGTARVARALQSQSVRVLNVDLSRHMLRQTVQHSTSSSACLQANLVQLECLRDSVLDMAVCLFSSIGMIRDARIVSGSWSTCSGVCVPTGRWSSTFTIGSAACLIRRANMAGAHSGKQLVESRM